MNQLKVDDFWAFSLNLYGQKGVQEACLTLQDDYQQNVNLILFVAFVYFKHIKIGTDELTMLVETIKGQHQALTSFRESRRALKGKDVSAYKEALQKELNFEKTMQLSLIEQFNHDKDTTLDAHFYPTIKSALIKTAELSFALLADGKFRDKSKTGLSKLEQNDALLRSINVIIEQVECVK